MEEDYRGFRIKIEQDTDSESPCNWDNYGLIAFKKRIGWNAVGERSYGAINLVLPNDLYELKTYKDDGEEYEEEVKTDPATYVERVYDAVITIPLKYIDFGSSGSEVRDCDADEANGVMYTTVKQIEMLYGKDYDLAKIREYMLEELEQFNQWLQGEVYCYSVENARGDLIDSCGGFYGYNETLKEVKAGIDRHIQYTAALPTYEVHVAVVFKVKAETRENAERYVKEELAKFAYPGTIVNLGGKLFD